MAYQIIQVTKEEWAEDTWPHIHVRFTPFSILEKNIVSLPDAQLYYIVIDDTTYNSAVTSQEAPGRTIDAIEYSTMGESLECLPQRRIPIVYIATNNITNRSYIGLTTYALEQRKRQHIRESRQKNRKQSYFHRSLLKYDSRFWQWDILEEVPESELNNAEIFWIQYFKYIGAELYNMTSGGDGVSRGYKHSEETRRKMSQALLGNKHSSGHRQSKEHTDKIRASKVRSYRLRSPDGNIITVTNMDEFCRSHGFSSGYMSDLIHAKHKCAYGWTLPEAEKESDRDEARAIIGVLNVCGIEMA